MPRIETFEVEQTYLAPYTNASGNNEGYQYVRRRGQKDSFSYTHHRLHRKKTATGVEPAPNKDKVLMLARAISGRDYLALLKLADPERCDVCYSLLISL